MKVKDFLKQHEGQPAYTFYVACDVEYKNDFEGNLKKRRDYICDHVYKKGGRYCLDKCLNFEVIKIETKKEEVISMDLNGNTTKSYYMSETALISLSDYLSINKELKKAVKRMNDYYSKRKRIIL